MSTPAQIAANRRNAVKSTGPHTAEGKAVASQNALTHGLSAQQLVIFDEQVTDFTTFHDSLRAALEPEDAMEEALVERIVLCAWRLRRAGRAEAALLLRSADAFRKPEEKRDFGRAWSNAHSDIGVLSRYEASIDRALRRAHLMLERRQARRRGEAVPPPIAVDVEVLPGHGIEAP